MATPIVVQSAGRGLMPGIVAGLMGTAGVTYGPQFFQKDKSEASQLAAALAALRQGPGVTVVTSPSGSKLPVIALSTFCLTGAGLLALKFAGVSLTSFVWVTRRHFRKGISTLEKGMESLSKRISEVRQGLLSKIEIIAGKQDKLAANQTEIRNDLNSLSIKVGQVEGGINCVKGVVDVVAQKIDSVEGKVDDSSALLQESHRGLLLLCRIVSNTIEKRETSFEEAKLLRDFAEKRGIESAKWPAFLPQGMPASENRRDCLREMIGSKQPMLGPATDVIRAWKIA